MKCQLWWLNNRRAISHQISVKCINNTWGEYTGKKKKIFCFKKVVAHSLVTFPESAQRSRLLSFQLGTRFLLPHQRILLHALSQHTPVFFLIEANSCSDVPCSTKDRRMMQTVLGCKMGGWTFFILSAVSGPLQTMWCWRLSWRCTTVPRHGDPFLFVKTYGNTILCDRHKWHCLHI